MEYGYYQVVLHRFEQEVKMRRANLGRPRDGTLPPLGGQKGGREVPKGIGQEYAYTT